MQVLGRLPRWGGIGFVVLFMVGVIMAGDAGLKDGAKIAAYFADHRTPILVGNQIAAIGLLCFLAWGWSLMNLFDDADAGSRLGIAVFVGAAMTVTVELAVMTLDMTLAVVSNQTIDPQIALVIHNASTDFSYIDYLPEAVFLVAFGAAVLRTSIVGHWVGWSALVIAALCLVAAGPTTGLDLPMALLSFVWIIAVNIAILRSPRAA